MVSFSLWGPRGVHIQTQFEQRCVSLSRHGHFFFVHQNNSIRKREVLSESQMKGKQDIYISLTQFLSL